MPKVTCRYRPPRSQSIKVSRGLPAFAPLVICPAGFAIRTCRSLSRASSRPICRLRSTLGFLTCPYPYPCLATSTRLQPVANGSNANKTLFVSLIYRPPMPATGRARDTPSASVGHRRNGRSVLCTGTRRHAFLAHVLCSGRDRQLRYCSFRLPRSRVLSERSPFMAGAISCFAVGGTIAPCPS